MSVIEVERPAPRTPERRDWFTWTDMAVRAVLLGLIVAAGVSVIPAHGASVRTSSDFLRDVSAHRVTSVDYRESTRQLRWADGWRHWHQADLVAGRAALPPVPKDAPSVTDQTFPSDTQANDDMTWAEQALLTANSRVTVDQLSSGDHMDWAADIPFHGLGLASGIALLLGFFLMLGRDRRRFASRWGWFWIFALGGAWGVGAFLLLEPMPLWWRSKDDRSLPQTPAIRGGRGFAIGLVLKAGLVWAGVSLVAYLGQQVPR